MTAELIRVDFKSRKVTERAQLLSKEAQEAPWVAAKDPDFKEYVQGIAELAEAMVEQGGDWKRMIVVMHDKVEADKTVCLTLYDNIALEESEVSAILTLANAKVTGTDEVMDES